MSYNRSPSPVRGPEPTSGPAPRAGRRENRGGNSDKKSTGCLFVGNIPFHFKEDDLREIFERIGELDYITIGIDKRTGNRKGHAFVQFIQPEDAEKAYDELQGHDIGGRQLRIDFDAGLNKKRSAKPHHDRHQPYERPYRPPPAHYHPSDRRRSPERYPPMDRNAPRRYASPPRRERSPPRYRRERSPPYDNYPPYPPADHAYPPVDRYSYVPRRRSPPPPSYERSPPPYSRMRGGPPPRDYRPSYDDREPMREPMHRDMRGPPRDNGPPLPRY